MCESDSELFGLDLDLDSELESMNPDSRKKGVDLESAGVKVVGVKVPGFGFKMPGFAHHCYRVSMRCR